MNPLPVYSAGRRETGSAPSSERVLAAVVVAENKTADPTHHVVMKQHVVAALAFAGPDIAVPPFAHKVAAAFAAPVPASNGNRAGKVSVRGTVSPLIGWDLLDIAGASAAALLASALDADRDTDSGEALVVDPVESVVDLVESVADLDIVLAGQAEFVLWVTAREKDQVDQRRQLGQIESQGAGNSSSGLAPGCTSRTF